MVNETSPNKLSSSKSRRNVDWTSLYGHTTIRTGIQDDETNEKERSRWRKHTRFYVIFIALPIIISLLYAIAILFPPGARSRAPLLLWSDGALEKIDGIYVLCPRESICSEGGFQIFLIAVARLTAFASYPLIGITFISKMHCTILALSTSYLGTIIPFAELHHYHKNVGRWLGKLSWVHVIAHIIRWGVRGDMALCGTQVGVSGIIGIVSMVAIVISMSSGRRQDIRFEIRFNLHWIFFCILVIVLCLHNARCRILTAIFSGLWLLDYFYGLVFKTYRLDLVEFTPLPMEAGVQMLWRNPPGFQANSGEYVKINLPWLSKGKGEWHPFSIYMHEATEEGLTEVLRKKYDVNTHKKRVHLDGLGGRQVNPDKTAILLIEFQNEYASEGGKLYDDVKDVIQSTGMIENTESLIDVARSVGAHIIHIPMVQGHNLKNPNKNLGILKQAHEEALFAKGTWNVEFYESIRPKVGDVVVQGKVGLDGFFGSDLQSHLEKRGIETVILGGFLTNCCVDSTMRTAYENGFNVITLTDGTACNSKEEQQMTIDTVFKMFSTPMTCAEAELILQGNTPQRFQSELNDGSEDVELGKEYVPPENNLMLFIEKSMTGGLENGNETSLIMAEARQQLRSQFDTTQVFIAPSGDWTKQVYKEVSTNSQLRSCWVRGPYISPYTSATKFSHLVMMATGIGITPALGVMGQFSGFSRTKVLIWSTRSAEMLKFFMPLLLRDSHMTIIFYTGAVKLSGNDIYRYTHEGNIFIQQSRPSSLEDAISTVIVNVTSIYGEGERHRRGSVETVKQITQKTRKNWALFYCGGSKRIRDELKEYSKDVGINYEFELFDW